jgi:hypothetical protein
MAKRKQTAAEPSVEDAAREDELLATGAQGDEERFDRVFRPGTLDEFVGQ